MVNRIFKKILYVPQSLDEESAGISLLLLKFLFGTTALTTALGVVLCLIQRENAVRWISVIVVINASTTVSTILIKRGLYRVASVFFLASIAVIIFTMAWSAGGIRAAAIIHLPIMVIATGLVWGWRQCFAACLIVSLGLLFLVLADYMDVLPPSSVSPRPLMLWVNYTIFIGILSLVQFLSTWRLNTALEKTRSELARRIRAEEDFRTSESRLQSVNSNLTDGMIYQVIGFADGTRKFTYLSDSVKKLYGVTPEQAMEDPMLIYSRVHENDIGVLKRAEEESIRSSTVFRCEARIKEPSGRIRWSSFVSTPTKLDDGSVRYDGIEFVITGRKLMEEETRKLASIVRHSSELINLADLDGNMVFLNEAGRKMLGIDLEAVEKTNIMHVIPDYLKDTVTRDVIPSLLAGKNWEGDLQYVNLKTGALTDVHALAFTIEDPETGTRKYLANVSLDISQRKLAEMRLRESEERLSGFMETASDGFYLLDSDLNFIEINRTALALLGKKKEDIIGRNIADIVPDVRSSGRYDRHLAVLRTGEPFVIEDFIPHPVFGERHFVLKSFRVGSGLGVIATDITEQKKAEIAIRRSAKQYKLVTELAMDYVFRFIVKSDRTLVLEFVSDNFYSITGRERRHIESVEAWGSIIHPDDMGMVTGMLGKLIAAPDSAEIECRSFIYGNQLRWINIVARSEYDEKEKRVAAITGAVKDITARKNAEEQLKASLTEKETLLRELYHRTKNNMQVISSMMNISTDKIQDSASLGVFREINTKIQSMALVHQKLYESRDLSHVNFREYLAELVQYLRSTYSMTMKPVDISINAEDVFLVIDIAIPCGIVVNELITNAMKHAFPDERKGAIEVGLHRIRDDAISLTVSDNGIGLRPGFTIGESHSLGLQTVRTIVVQQLKGSISLESDHGTKVTITIKTDLYAQRL